MSRRTLLDVFERYGQPVPTRSGLWLRRWGAAGNVGQTWVFPRDVGQPRELTTFLDNSLVVAAFDALERWCLSVFDAHARDQGIPVSRQRTAAERRKLVLEVHRALAAATIEDAARSLARDGWEAPEHAASGLRRWAAEFGRAV